VQLTRQRLVLAVCGLEKRGTIRTTTGKLLKGTPPHDSEYHIHEKGLGIQDFELLAVGFNERTFMLTRYHEETFTTATYVSPSVPQCPACG
jgi:hypothetical protein